MFWVAVCCSAPRQERDEEICTEDRTETDEQSEIEDTSSYREHRGSTHEYAILIDDSHPVQHLPSPERGVG